MALVKHSFLTALCTLLLMTPVLLFIGSSGSWVGSFVCGVAAAVLSGLGLASGRWGHSRLVSLGVLRGDIRGITVLGEEERCRQLWGVCAAGHFVLQRVDVRKRLGVLAHRICELLGSTGVSR